MYQCLLLHLFHWGAMLEFGNNLYFEEGFERESCLYCTGRCDGLILRMAEELEPHSFWTHEQTDGRERKKCPHRCSRE